MDEIGIVDTTLRDGQQSLWACRMRTAMMLPMLADLDAAGYDGIEYVVASAQFPRAVRDLGDNPWDWLNQGAPMVTRTPLRLHGGIDTRLAKVPLCVWDLYFQKVVALGIRLTRTSDPWNDFASLAHTVAFLKQRGIGTVVNVIYSASPRHTVDYYARKTREAVAIGGYRICLKDVGGLLTPEAARAVIPAVVENAGDTPVEFHAHCNSGMAPYVTLIAAEMGIRILHTAIPPLAQGTSQPSVFGTVRDLRSRGFRVPLDLAAVDRASAHLSAVAEAEGLPVGRAQEFDQTLFDHQIPGGMMSNLEYQLTQLGKPHLLGKTLVEAAHVRADLGYPIMVTPLAQFVGSQATVNVITGTRYGTVTDEIIAYALGQWGAEAIEVMDPSVRERILDRPRAAAIAAEPENGPERTLADVRASMGGEISDEELITRSLLGPSGALTPIPSSRPNPLTYREYQASRQTLVEVLGRFASSRRVASIDVQRRGLRVVAEKPIG